MLDDDLHTSLPEADVTAFFQAELRSYVRSLKRKRIVEHVDGSMTTAKARTNNLEAFVLHGLSEHGLRKEMPQAQLANLAPMLRNEAADIQRAKYEEFMSTDFNDGVMQRAESQFGELSFTEYDRLCGNRRQNGRTQRTGGCTGACDGYCADRAPRTPHIASRTGISRVTACYATSTHSTPPVWGKSTTLAPAIVSFVKTTSLRQEK